MYKIYIDGKDGLGWSIDKDREHLEKSISRIGCQVTNNFISADIIHNIWWDSLLSRKKYLLRFKKKILVTTSNFVNLHDNKYCLRDSFDKVNKFSTAWIVPSSKQKKVFDEFNIKNYYLPFTIDIDIFDGSYRDSKKEEVIKLFNINREKIKNKIIIGSFQRDSLGSDLSLPKWQKGPDLLIGLLSKLPRDKFTLLLAGPRRHYVINECKKHNIEYLYVGTETPDEDLITNSLDINKISKLYALLDIYLVTSVSEGGPKAILESAVSRTMVMSTNVGLAADFIDSDYVFDEITDYEKCLKHIVTNFYDLKELLVKVKNDNYRRVINQIGTEAYDKRLIDIYNEIMR